MTTGQVKGHLKEAEGKIKEVTGKLVGNDRLEEKGKAEKNAAERKVLYEDLKEDFRKLA